MDGKTIEDKSVSFVNNAKKECNEWVFNNVISFMQFQLERINKKELTGPTMRNYLMCISYFAKWPISRLHGKRFQEACQEQKIMQMIEFLLMKR